MLLFLIFGDFYSGEFMEIGVGARAIGMGSAMVGLADDGTAFYWNPAGIANKNLRELFFMYSDDFEGEVKNYTIAITYPGKKYNLASAIYLLAVPKVQFADTDTFVYYKDIYDGVGYISYGQKFKNLRLGGNLKIIYREWSIVKGYGLSYDFGLLYKIYGINFGINLVNLFSTPIFMDKNRISLPLLIKWGVSKQTFLPKNDNFIIAIGFVTYTQKIVAQFTPLHTDLSVGCEYFYHNKLALRAGIDKGNLSFGFGVIYHNINIDGAIKLHNELGPVKRASIFIPF